MFVREGLEEAFEPLDGMFHAAGGRFGAIGGRLGPVGRRLGPLGRVAARRDRRRVQRTHYEDCADEESNVWWQPQIFVDPPEGGW